MSNNSESSDTDLIGVGLSKTVSVTIENNATQSATIEIGVQGGYATNAVITLNEGRNELEIITGDYKDPSGANSPVLAEGMIPVVYDETCESEVVSDNASGCWEVADTSTAWYSYSDQIWANAVTTSVASYRTASAGTEISMDDINLPDELKRYDLMWSLYEGDKNVSNGTFEATESKIDVAPYQVFEVNDTKTYNLYIWIEETGIDQKDMMGQTFKTTVKAVGESYHATPETRFGFSNGTITSYDYDTCGTDVIIPETIGGVAVTKIGHAAFTKADINGEGYWNTR